MRPQMITTYKKLEVWDSEIILQLEPCQSTNNIRCNTTQYLRFQVPTSNIVISG